MRNRIRELQEERITLMGSQTIVRPESKELMEACLAELQGRCQEISGEEASIAALGMEELEAFVERMKKEVHAVEEECRAYSNEIEELTGSIAEESAHLDKDLQDLDHDLELYRRAETNQAEAFPDAHPDYSFKVTGLTNLTEKTGLALSTLENLQNKLKMHEAIDQIEDKFSNVKVMDIENNWLRLALKTHISVDSLPKKPGLVIDPLCLEHELLIEVNGETMEVLDLKIFPSDISLDAVIDDSRSSWYALEKVIRHVQQQIMLCTLRNVMVKNAKNLGRSIEYLDRDDVVIIHLAGGVNVYLKISQGWPVSDSVLTLASVKTMGTSMENMSLSLLHEIKDLGNSLDKDIRWSLPGFVDAVEEIFVSKTQPAGGANASSV